MRVIGASTVGRPCISAMAAFMVPSRAGEDDEVGLGRARAAHLVGLALQHGVDADAGTARMPVTRPARRPRRPRAGAGSSW
jgi:hypothetical protein